MSDILSTTQKHPQETKDIAIAWTALLDGETIATSVWAVTTGLTLVSDDKTGGVTVARVSGGTAGARYYLQNTVTFSGGQVRVAQIAVDVFSDRVT